MTDHPLLFTRGARSLAAATIVVLAIASPRPAAGQTPIVCGQMRAGTIGAVAQQDSYTFNATAGNAVILVAMATSGNLSARLDLNGPDGKPVPGGNNGFGNGSTGSIILPLTGLYTVLVHDQTYDRLGTYNLSLRFATGQCAGSIICGQTLSGTIEAPAQQDSYSFIAKTGDAVILGAIATSGTLAARLDLYGPDGTPVPGGNNGFGNGATGSVPLRLTGGVYTVIVRDQTYNRVGSYNLHLRFTTGQCAAPLGCGQTVPGEIPKWIHHDGYSFRATAGTVVVVAAVATSGNLAARLDVYDSGGVAVAGGNNGFGNGATGNVPLTAGGTYTIAVRDQTYNKTGRYNLNLRVVAGSCLNPIGISSSADFDGDHKIDFAVWRPATGAWSVIRSSNGSSLTQQWGFGYAPEVDVPVPADYDGDGKADFAVWRRSTGVWFVIKSSDGTQYARQWGGGVALYDDIPVPGDYDGDGKADMAVWRRSSGVWYIVRSSDGGITIQQWGAGGAPYDDRPVPADYDGDGRTDVAVFRQSTGVWYIFKSLDGPTASLWGNPSSDDVPVAADYDGDRKADIGVWRPSNGTWYVMTSSNGGVAIRQWGDSAAPFSDLPVPDDYDGDGKADVAVWRQSTEVWYVLKSSGGAIVGQKPANAFTLPD